jgi:hypothetical protein
MKSMKDMNKKPSIWSLDFLSFIGFGERGACPESMKRMEER